MTDWVMLSAVGSILASIAMAATVIIALWTITRDYNAILKISIFKESDKDSKNTKMRIENNGRLNIRFDSVGIFFFDDYFFLKKNAHYEIPKECHPKNMSDESNMIIGANNTITFSLFNDEIRTAIRKHQEYVLEKNSESFFLKHLPIFKMDIEEIRNDIRFQQIKIIFNCSGKSYIIDEWIPTEIMFDTTEHNNYFEYRLKKHQMMRSIDRFNNLIPFIFCLIYFAAFLDYGIDYYGLGPFMVLLSLCILNYCNSASTHGLWVKKYITICIMLSAFLIPIGLFLSIYLIPNEFLLIGIIMLFSAIFSPLILVAMREKMIKKAQFNEYRY